MNKTSFNRVLTSHAEMILDRKRTDPLRESILKIVKQGDVVCDIGAGLGLLTLFALSAGAKRVYAIDCDRDSLEAAVHYAAAHGVTDRISFIEAHSQDVNLDEKMDVLICEIIGSAAFDENILATLADAKKRLLKKGGRIIPYAIELWGAPATFVHKRSRSELIPVQQIGPKDMLCKPACLVSIKTNKIFGENLHIRHAFRSLRDAKMTGLALWPKIEWAPGLVTDASPLKATTHWKQCALPVRAEKVSRGQELNAELIIAPDGQNPRYQTEILWKLTPR